MGRTVVTALAQTCDVCPSQWEGRTADGQYIYVRYRWGHLQIGLGATMAEAVADEMTFDSQISSDHMDGKLTYADLITTTADWIDWPCDVEHR